MKRLACHLLLFSLCTVCAGQNSKPAKSEKGWWLTEPVSLVQTNLRETDSNLDPKALISWMKEFPFNTLLFSFGGITAHYPTHVNYHYASKYLPAGKDLVGEVIQEAHHSGIRVIGRFDFSRTRKEVYDAHPDWFYKRSDGHPVVDDNALYSTCINGGYYHEKAMEILGESLDQHDADGYFFNWFGNIRNDYKGNAIGLCHCAECERKFQELYGRSIPDTPDKVYDEFIYKSAIDVAKLFEQLIHAKRPRALFMTYVSEATDAVVSEADFYKTRSLPQWIYTASESVNSELNMRPDKMVVDLVMPYEELRYRFATVSGPGLRTLLYQNLAHGTFPAFVVLGGIDQPDRSGLNAVRPVFQYYEKHRDEFLNQKSAARVILYGTPAPLSNRNSANYRGMFKLLSELHVPFKVTDKTAGLDKKDIDLVIVANTAMTDDIKEYIKHGGSVLALGTLPTDLIPEKQVRLWDNTSSGYMRVNDHKLFPSLHDVDVILCEGPYLELSPSDAPITFIPPGPFGPPDKVSSLKEVTDKPGLLVKTIGTGKLADIPWNIGELYYKFSNDKHRMLISDLINYLLPNNQRQLVTNAHPSVEITLMRQSVKNRHLLHLINLSGHSSTTYFDAIEMKNITIQVKGNFRKAMLMDSQQILSTKAASGYTFLTIPVLTEFTTVLLYE